MATNDFNITQEYLLNRYEYNSETGIVTTKYTRKVVGWNHNDYLVVTIKGKKRRLHRLIWLMVYGEQPNIIDHINFNKKDNRLINLRSVTNAQNVAHRNNDLPKSNVPYITWVKNQSHWKCLAKKDNNLIYLGIFNNLNDAIFRQDEFYRTSK